MLSDMGAIYRLPSGADAASLGLPDFTGIEDGTSMKQRLQRRLRGPISRSYNGVVALAIQRKQGDTTQVLVGIRTNTTGGRLDDAKTQPYVVSVPTEVVSMKRIAESLDEDTARIGSNCRSLYFSGKEWRFTRSRDCYRTNVGLLATHMLATKVGLEGKWIEELSSGAATFRYQNVCIGCSRVGYNYDPETQTEEYSVEGVAMLNIAVTVDEGYDKMFPGASSELDRLKWVDEASFVRGTKSSKVSDFYNDQVDGTSKFRVCAYGLCLATTAMAIDPTYMP